MIFETEKHHEISRLEGVIKTYRDVLTLRGVDVSDPTWDSTYAATLDSAISQLQSLENQLKALL